VHYDGTTASSSLDQKYQCNSSISNGHLNDFHWRGTNLGGWLVLEPWITPSLFYQFLGVEDPSKVALDSYTFCTALGKDEANRQLRLHWEAWVTEAHIRELAAKGVDTVRIPVADWMFAPYEPFIGCWDGSREMLDRVLDWCHTYGIKALLDVHTMLGSQNPFDNSGHANEIIWLTSNSYIHHDNSEFMGEYGPDGKNGTKLEYFCEEHVEHAMEVAEAVVESFHTHPAVIAFEPVNEPWAATPLPLLKEFYWKVYILVQKRAPHWVTVLHDSFRFSTAFWGGFLHGCPNFALDTHIYLAWSDPSPEQTYQSAACNNALNIRQMERSGVPVIVGEYSLSVSGGSCAQWLNGLNDALPGFPKVACERSTCPQSYLQNFPYEYKYKDQDQAAWEARLGGAKEETRLGQIPEQVLADPKYDTHPVGPFGSGGESYIVNGTCLFEGGGSFSINATMDDHIVAQIGLALLSAFDSDSHGQFFWNFRTELEEKWDFRRAVDRGWLPGFLEAPGTGIWTPGTGAVAQACSVQGKLPLVNHSLDVPVSESEAEIIAETAAAAAQGHARRGHHVLIMGVALILLTLLLALYPGPLASLWRVLSGQGSGDVEMSARNARFRYEPIPDSEA